MHAKSWPHTGCLTRITPGTTNIWLNTTFSGTYSDQRGHSHTWCIIIIASPFLGVKFAFAFKQTPTIYSTYSWWFAVFGTNAYRVCCAARSQSKDPSYMDIHKDERQDVVWPTRWDIGKQRRVCGQRGPHLMYICESIYTEGRNQPQLITQPPWHTL